MAESEKELIKADELRFTWWTGIGTGLTALVSGIAVVADRLTSLNLDPQLMQALILFAAVGAIATAIVVSVDVLARAWVTVADKRALPGTPPMLLGKGTAPSVLSPPATAVNPFKVRVKHAGPELFTVLALGWDPETTKERYLVGRKAESPRWVAGDEIERAFYEPKPSSPPRAAATTNHHASQPVP